MATQLLVESMETLFTIHNLLLEAAIEKTEAIKKNDMQKLSGLLREEQKHITAIQVADQKRQKAVAILMNNNEATISDVIEELIGPEQVELKLLQERLIAVIAELKNANALNQQLLTYSMQFVNMNLDILAPEPELPNYSKTNNENDQPETGRSMFDSKA
ncbi:flagellar protein FlgN [Bacillus sp. FSL K6-3431]|uniref:flagellar protein FlgN n=1 Tax=Bacillus sp. FSL K6-3431 TaxID=2921500 RepID=UPI0030F64722